MESVSCEWENEIDDWVENIVSVVPGVPVHKKSDMEMLQEEMAFAKSEAEPIEKIQGLFGIKSDRPVSCKCPSCGAALNGIKCETIKCPYCGTFYTF